MRVETKHIGSDLPCIGIPLVVRPIGFQLQIDTQESPIGVALNLALTRVVRRVRIKFNPSDQFVGECGRVHCGCILSLRAKPLYHFIDGRRYRSRRVRLFSACTYRRHQISIENPNATGKTQNSIETQTHLTGTKILSKRNKQHLLCSLLSYCKLLLKKLRERSRRRLTHRPQKTRFALSSAVLQRTSLR